MTYDVNGNLLTRTQSGFSGATAISRTTTTTYNNGGWCQASKMIS